MKKIIAGTVIVVVFAGAAYFVGRNSAKDSAQTPEAAPVIPRVGDAPVTPAAPFVSINIKKGSFDPATITIKKGTEVVWVNTDAVAHTVTSDDGGITLNSQSIPAAHSFAHLFTEAKTVSYHCAIDRAMKGTIIIEN